MPRTTEEERQTEHETLLMRSFPLPRVRATRHASLAGTNYESRFSFQVGTIYTGPDLSCSHLFNFQFSLTLSRSREHLMSVPLLLCSGLLSHPCRKSKRAVLCGESSGLTVSMLFMDLRIISIFAPPHQTIILPLYKHFTKIQNHCLVNQMREVV